MRSKAPLFINRSIDVFVRALIHFAERPPSAVRASRRRPPNGDRAKRLARIRCMVWLGVVIGYSLVSTEAQ